MGLFAGRSPHDLPAAIVDFDDLRNRVNLPEQAGASRKTQEIGWFSNVAPGEKIVSGKPRNGFDLLPCFLNLLC
jgi:hypothetical protein